MQDFGQGRSPVDQVWGALKRRRWLAAITFVATAAVIASIAFSLPEYYRASASIMVDQTKLPPSVSSTVSEELEPRLFAVTQAVTSRENLIQLIEEEGLYREVEDRDPAALVDRMRRDISIERERVELAWGRGATIAFTLTYQGFDRDAVARVTNRLADLYVSGNSRIRERQASQATDLLKTQLDATKAKLDDHERRINSYRESRLGQLPEQQSANLATLERLNAQLRINSENQLRTMERRRELQLRLDDEGYTSADGASLRMSRLRRELADLRTRYSDRHPDVIRLQAEIDQLEERGTLQSEPIPGSLQHQIARLDDELQTLQREEARLRNATAVYEQRIANMPRIEHELSSLTRDYNAIREQYTQLLASYEDALVAESLETGARQEFQVMDYAVAPDAPAGPPRLRLLAMGLVLALMLAGAVVVVAEQFDSSFHTIDELKGFTNVPVVAGIPQIITLGDLVRSWVRVGASVAATVALVSVLALGGWLFASDNVALVALMTGRG